MRHSQRFVMAFVLAALLAVTGVAGTASAPSCSARATGQAGAYVVSEERISDRIVDLTVQSPALGRTAIVRLITPRGWDQRRHGQRWPVLYLLHGCCDTPDSWTRETDVEEIAALRNVLVVTPEGGEVGWYSNWWNHGAGGPPAWETFHLTEVRRLLERGYGAGKRRVIAGLSMGGAGAMTYAARHRRMFRAAASYSGVVHPLADPYGLLGAFRDFGAEDPYAIWGDPLAQIDIWTDHDPVYLAPSLRGKQLFLAVGNGEAGPFDPPGTFDGDEAFLQGQSIALFARLRQLRIPVTTDFYGPGTHTLAVLGARAASLAPAPAGRARACVVELEGEAAGRRQGWLTHAALQPERRARRRGDMLRRLRRPGFPEWVPRRGDELRLHRQLPLPGRLPARRHRGRPGLAGRVRVIGSPRVPGPPPGTRTIPPSRRRPGPRPFTPDRRSARAAPTETHPAVAVGHALIERLQRRASASRALACSSS